MKKMERKNHYLNEIRGNILGNCPNRYTVLTYKTLIKSFKSTFPYLNSVAEVRRRRKTS
jgi:hypothetical protein